MQCAGLGGLIDLLLYDWVVCLVWFPNPFASFSLYSPTYPTYPHLLTLYSHLVYLTAFSMAWACRGSAAFYRNSHGHCGLPFFLHLPRSPSFPRPVVFLLVIKMLVIGVLA